MSSYHEKAWTPDYTFLAEVETWKSLRTFDTAGRVWDFAKSGMLEEEVRLLAFGGAVLGTWGGCCSLISWFIKVPARPCPGLCMRLMSGVILCATREQGAQ